MSDGLTVPFALAAGLSGAIHTTSIIVVAGLTEIAAGSIAMRLGGFVTKELGLWIDHRETVIVTITDEGEETKQIESGMEKHVRFSGGSGARELHGIQESEDKQDRRFEDHLNAYYDAVIASIRDADSILIFGPGEAKVELKKRLEGQHLGGRIVGIETFDKMSDRQIAAKVRQHFSK